MNSTIAKLADEFEKMEKTIASQKKMIETLISKVRKADHERYKDLPV